MSIIGDRTRFAVEYRLDEKRRDTWLFGGMCFWIGGERVGPIDQELSLRDVLAWLATDRQHHGRRRNTILSSLRAGWVVDLIDGFVDELWGRHVLNPGLDIHDSWKVYLVESDQAARLLYRRDTGETKECVLDPGECDEVLRRTFDEIEGLYLEELAQFPRTREYEPKSQ